MDNLWTMICWNEHLKCCNDMRVILLARPIRELHERPLSMARVEASGRNSRICFAEMQRKLDQS